METLSEAIQKQLNESVTVCDLCPDFDPGKPYEDECKRIFTPLFNQLKEGADKNSKMFRGDPEACAAIIKGTMDFLIRNLGNIVDDEINIHGWLTDIFDYDDGFIDQIADTASEYYDFGGKSETYDYIEKVADKWDQYCKNVIKMAWY